MRILYHHRTLGDGAEGIHIREMVKAFRSIGHEVKVAGPVGEKVPEPGREKGILSRIKKNLPGWAFEILEVLYSLACLASLAKEIRRFRPNFIYDRYITFNFGALLAARLFRIPYILEVNAPLALERSEQPDERLYLRRLAFAVERYVCSKADWTIVVSTPLKDYLVSIGVPAEKCVVMPNGVDPEKFQPKAKDQALMSKLGIPDDAVVIGFAGILRPWHGLDMLIDATARLHGEGKNIFLLIVGDGPIQQEIESALVEKGLQSLSRITGRVSHEKISEFVNLFDVAVSPKATFYASPMKLVEYMALGKTVLAPDSPNLRDMVDHLENGLLFEANSPQSLAEQLANAMASPELRGVLGANGAEKVVSRLNWKWNAREVVDLIGDNRRQENLAFSRER